MNCKPGDLAIIERNLPTEAEAFADVQLALLLACRGMVVRVTRLHGTMWELAETRAVQANFFNVHTQAIAKASGELKKIGDQYLVPIGGVPVTDEVEDEAPVKQSAAERLREYCRLFTSSSY
ncbi:conserved hypothetical protein [Burkholderia gladioli]|uniref:hypothetical protein n=1 Tax=Burkholderia gladioli TaxID=28095 RepID=UPI001CACA2B3|nr:hypothetical protein [Burkholderia gladioli]CAG9193569.1 conserved hypothetical protein [Burkholderia gladioli]